MKNTIKKDKTGNLIYESNEQSVEEINASGKWETLQNLIWAVSIPVCVWLLAQIWY